MFISLRQLRVGAAQNIQTRTLSEARTHGLQTAFLSYSHLDAVLARGLVALLESSGWKVYVDWQDSDLLGTADGETASRIKTKIIDHQWFLFLATENSMRSRWCPWEIGYADGKKPLERIIVIPTSDDSGQSHGNEYLLLYRRLELSNEKRLVVWQPRTTSAGVFIESLRP